MLVLVFCGGIIAFSGHGARDTWLSALLLGGGACIVIGAIWTTLWTYQHGSFNLAIDQKAKRIRKWKTSLFLKRSFDEYAYDEFHAIRSMQKFEGEAYCVVVELLFKATRPVLEVARFNPIGRGASWWRGGAWLRTESPRGAALRQELVSLMGITDTGYFDKEL